MARRLTSEAAARQENHDKAVQKARAAWNDPSAVRERTRARALLRADLEASKGRTL